MAKTTLAGFGNPNDPLGYVPPREVEIDDEPSAPAKGARIRPRDGDIELVSVSRRTGNPWYDAFDATSTKADDSADIKLVPVQERTGNLWYDAFDASGYESEAAFSKGSAADFHKFTQFTKVQETEDGDIVVYGIATHEKPDLDGECCDYETAKDAYQKWSTAAVSRTSAAGQQISLGPIRYQHGAEPAGKAVKIDYDDDAKEIWLGSIPINDDIRKQLQDGYLTGYSQGGSYAWRRCADCNKSLTLQQANNYCPDCKRQVPVLFGLKRLSEVSYVDSPCTGKGFDYVKQDGSSRFVSFSKRDDSSNPAAGVQIIDSMRLFGKVWKHTLQASGRRHSVLMRGDEILLVA